MGHRELSVHWTLHIHVDIQTRPRSQTRAVIITFNSILSRRMAPPPVPPPPVPLPLYKPCPQFDPTWPAAWMDPLFAHSYRQGAHSNDVAGAGHQRSGGRHLQSGVRHHLRSAVRSQCLYKDVRQAGFHPSVEEAWLCAYSFLVPPQGRRISCKDVLHGKMNGVNWVSSYLDLHPEEDGNDDPESDGS
jgi:hypothetical protein